VAEEPAHPTLHARTPQGAALLASGRALTSEREGLHESLALEMGASLSGEGGAAGGDGAPQAVGGRWRANPLAPGQLDAAGRKAQRLLVVGDGEFSVAGLRASLPEDVVLLRLTSLVEVNWAASVGRVRAFADIFGPSMRRALYG
jgi:hypothetical protein